MSTKRMTERTHGAYMYRAYCDICNKASKWFSDDEGATDWRMDHFERTHPNNPMKKENCRIQRETL